jgi:hypothetical protein
MPREDFEHFRQRVLEDPALQQALSATPDLPTFLALARKLGAEHGCHFTDEDVRAEMNAARRAWLERWI